MGIGGVSVGSLLIVLVIVMLLFGTKRLRNIGGDLGGALSGFRRPLRKRMRYRKAWRWMPRKNRPHSAKVSNAPEARSCVCSATA